MKARQHIILNDDHISQLITNIDKHKNTSPIAIDT